MPVTLDGFFDAHGHPKEICQLERFRFSSWSDCVKLDCVWEEIHMENTKKYEYLLEQSEIQEFSFYAILEQVKYHKGKWIWLLFVLVLELILLPRAAAWMAGLIAVLLLVSIIFTYNNTRKNISGQQWTVWLEGGMLKVNRGGSSEVPCSNIQLFRTTHRLLMLGYLQTAQRPAWFIIPLRVFADVQEREQFLDSIRHAQRAEDRDVAAEGIPFTYTLDEAKWVHFHKGAAGILTSGTLGRTERMRTVLVSIIFVVMSMLFLVYLVEGRLSWQWAAYVLGITILIILRIFFRDPEKAFKKQIRTPVVRDRECGVWQVTLSESGIDTKLSTGIRNFYAWEMLGWYVETGDAFYVFHKDKRHYVLIAKESFQDWNQVSAMHELCARKGVTYVRGRKMRYLPDCAFVLMAVLFVVLCIGVMSINIFWRNVQETREQLRRAPQEGSESADYLEQEPRETALQEGPEPEDYPEQEPREIVWQDDFNLADYPDYVPLDRQVEVLESFGFEVPEEVVESARDSVTEYGLRAFVEGDPYTWLLTSLGAPQYNEDWTAIEQYSKGVFWFDFEGWGYADVLNGMLALAQDSCLDTVTNISEDDSKVDWERGKGTLTVSLEWDGQTYHWDMNVHYDWIDSDVLGILNALLIEGKSRKYFYVTGDNGQGAIVFFCTAEWAENFSEATGLELESCSVWSVEQEEHEKTP